MDQRLNRTHDMAARSWEPSANSPGGDFPIQNLPFGVFRRRGSSEPFRGGVAIGDKVVDLAALAEDRPFEGAAAEALAACTGPTLNALLALGAPAWSALRAALFDLFNEGAADRAHTATTLVGQDQCEHAVPVLVGDYTDFYTSVYHAVNIGKLFGFETRGTNFEWMPIAYHGRSSSIGVSGQRFRRPTGQLKASPDASPMVGPTRKLDYELELALYVGTGNGLGEPIPVASAERHLFGVGLLNDWSARDIQAWEMQPLGPLLAKNFATTVSPWIVTMEALVPYRCAFERPDGPPALPYLDAPSNRDSGAIDIRLEVLLETEAQRGRAEAPTRLSRTSFKHQYWTFAQMVAHHTVGGCNLQPGDLLGSGTISGPDAGEAGALMELARNGAEPFALSTGEARSFVEDGDAVIMRGHCEKPGFARIGFGECRGEVLPARPPAA